MDPNNITIVNKRHFVLEANADNQYIGRGSNSRLGNPFTHKEGTTAKYKVTTVEEAVEKFHQYLHDNYSGNDGMAGWPTKNYIDDLFKSYKAGNKINLICWCAPKGGLKVHQKPWICHGQVIAHAIIKLAGDSYE